MTERDSCSNLAGMTERDSGPPLQSLRRDRLKTCWNDKKVRRCEKILLILSKIIKIYRRYIKYHTAGLLSHRLIKIAQLQIGKFLFQDIRHLL
jgi:hypothetical protein